MDHKKYACHLRQHIKSIFILCCAIAFSFSAHSQTLNLYDAINRAVTNYPLIQQRQAEVAANRAHVRTVNNYRLPSLRLMDEVVGGTSNSLPGAYFSMGVVPSNSSSVRADENTTMSSGNIGLGYLDWPVYTFGYYNAQSREAKASLATSQAFLNSDTYLLTSSIINLYLDWLKKYRLLRIESQNLQRSGTILQAIRANVISGLKPGVDSSTASAEYSRNRIAYIQALNDYQNDRVALTTYTGGDTAIAPDTTLLSVAMQQNIFSLQPSDSLSIDHPLINVYQKLYEQQKASNAAISKSYLPKLSVEGAGWGRGSSISYNDHYDPNLMNGLGYSRYNYLFGLTLSYNLFDLKHQHDRIVEGRYLAESKQKAMQTQVANLNESLQQANIAYAGTQEKLKELPVELHSAQDAYNQQMALYRSGLNTLIDVTNALYVLNRVETDNVLAQDELLQELFLRAALSNQLSDFVQKFKQ
jgi:outer membrane protein TolC